MRRRAERCAIVGERAPDANPRRKVRPSFGGREDVERLRALVRHDLRGIDPRTVQSATCTEVAEESTIRRGMTGTHVEDAPARELHADEVMVEDSRVADA